MLDRVYRRIDAGVYAEQLNRIVDFERTLADSGALILKFWMHLDKARQEERLTRLEKDPLTRWRVTKREWRHWRMYDRFLDAAERAIRHTSRGAAPWVIVEGADPNYRSLAIGTAVRDAIRQRLETQAPAEAPTPHVSKFVAVPKAPARAPARASARVPAVHPPIATTTTILGHLDMSLRLEKKDATRKIEQWQGRLNQLQRKAAARGISTVMVFEGWDAAGKGGAIRRITSALDAREYQVIPIAVPTDEERAHHYLWRFWRHLSRAGRVTLFDRSWYGRVLVERVEGFASEPEWMRAYSEINQFEDQLVTAGTVLVKYWLHVTPGEQLRRFKDRQATTWKRWKITDEDWRNRERWPAYELAVNDMVERTSTHAAPWTLIEADDKAYARVKVLRTACDRLREALE